MLVADTSDSDKILVKLTDFGFAYNSTESEHCETKNIFCGTVCFMAPELLEGRVENITEKVDIWAVGIMTHFLLTGQFPFRGSEYNEVKNNVLAYNLVLAKDKLSPIAQEFIMKCLARNSEQRVSADQLLDCRIFSGAISMAHEQKKFQIQANILNYMGTGLFQKSILSFMTKLMQDVDQLRDHKRVFELMDTNRDGKLEMSELEAGMNEFTKLFQMPELDVVKIFQEIDIDGNGDANGHTLIHSHTGGIADVDIVQSGTNDNMITLTTSGDNADIDISQTD